MPDTENLRDLAERYRSEYIAQSDGSEGLTGAITYALRADRVSRAPDPSRDGLVEAHVAAFEKAIGLVSVDMAFAMDAIRHERAFTASQMLSSLSSLRDSIRREMVRVQHPDMGAEDLTAAVRSMPHPAALSAIEASK